MGESYLCWIIMYCPSTQILNHFNFNSRITILINAWFLSNVISLLSWYLKLILKKLQIFVFIENKEKIESDFTLSGEKITQSRIYVLQIFCSDISNHLRFPHLQKGILISKVVVKLLSNGKKKKRTLLGSSSYIISV